MHYNSMILSENVLAIYEPFHYVFDYKEITVPSEQWIQPIWTRCDLSYGYVGSLYVLLKV